ncbi:hypothetical protein TWF694_011785 [Orbilia ellipsospora]|uniref:MYND-type domain-containing protein n=1 Tax=Orbilia ellipsospora TaxID=2528407 RepID=A0AAV9X680_9PEZI
MEDKNALSLEEQRARVLWAAHILSYLSPNSSHTDVLDATKVQEQQEEDDVEISDDGTDIATILQESEESAIPSKKFLDCVAQLFSPNKGAKYVTATSLREHSDSSEIVVDIARNDGFGGVGFSQEEQDYCNQLKDYLARCTSTALEHQNEFEYRSVQYSSRRVNHSIKMLRSTLETALERLDRQKKSLFDTLLLLNFLVDMTENIDTKRIPLLSTRALQCSASIELATQLDSVFGGSIRTKIVNQLRLIARPILNCRILHQLASRYPQFRKVQFFAVTSPPRIGIDEVYCIDICEAWSVLRKGAISEAEEAKLLGLGKQRDFKIACLSTYELHAEIALYMRYEKEPELSPTLRYFGCSKKACLLCDSFLRSLPSPISTRGGHGICYATWGVPTSGSTQTKLSLNSLENNLVQRIRRILDTPKARKDLLKGRVPQSTIISDFETLAIQGTTTREEGVKALQEAENARRRQRQILEGAALSSSTPDFYPADSCVMCNKSPANICSRCRSSWYCSQDCQQSDWSSHKLLCRAFAEQRPRPSPRHKRGIFFSALNKKPEMIWLPCEPRIDEDDGISYEHLDTHPYLGTDNPWPGRQWIEWNPIRNRRLGAGMSHWAPRKEGFAILIKFRDAFSKDGSPLNQSILASVRAMGSPPHKWCGPLVAIRNNADETYADITLTDFRHIIDHFMSYNLKNTRDVPPNPLDHAVASIRGVKICCYGEQKLHGSEEYVSVEVPKSHLARVGVGVEMSPISNLLGLKLNLWKYDDLESWFDVPGWDENHGPDGNPNAAFMMIETDSKSEMWGWAGFYWDSGLGNVLVVREDGKDLDVEEVRMMSYFSRFVVSPMIEDAKLCGAEITEEEVKRYGFVKRTKEEVMGFITRENMIKEWGKKKNKRIV